MGAGQALRAVIRTWGSIWREMGAAEGSERESEVILQSEGMQRQIQTETETRRDGQGLKRGKTDMFKKKDTEGYRGNK